MCCVSFGIEFFAYGFSTEILNPNFDWSVSLNKPLVISAFIQFGVLEWAKILPLLNL